MQDADKPGERDLRPGPEPDVTKAEASGSDAQLDADEGASLSPEIQEKLGEKLREVYSDVMNEPVPDRFMELLAKLEGASEEEGGASS